MPRFPAKLAGSVMRSGNATGIGIGHAAASAATAAQRVRVPHAAPAAALHPIAPISNNRHTKNTTTAPSSTQAIGCL
jgi:hypothetical protein